MVLATFQNGFRDKTTPTLTTPLVRANMSCAVATIFSSLDFRSLSVSIAKLSSLVAATFSSLALLSSSVSTANLSCSISTTFSSFRFSQPIVVTSLQSFESGRALWFSVFVCSRLILSPSFLYSLKLCFLFMFLISK